MRITAPLGFEHSQKVSCQYQSIRSPGVTITKGSRLDIIKIALEKLKSAGTALAPDDFGTGYSSLTYLQRYPFDHIKIDMSFVLDVLVDEHNKKFSEAIIALAKSLGQKSQPKVFQMPGL